MLAPTFFTKACVVAAILSWCFDPASAARVKTYDEAELSFESDYHLAAGHLLRDRYELDRFLERRALKGPDRRAVPGESFPAIDGGRRQLSDAHHLGTGSFGDVWSAMDQKSGKKVAVKIFYRNGAYLSWNAASKNDFLEFENAKKECKLNEVILGNRAMDPVGASRICACYGEHISDGKGTNLPVFLVQEMCGKTLEKFFIDKHKATGTTDVDVARDLTRQLLEGINFMQKFDPPLIHHDLKPENVAVTDSNEIKIIDWGAMIFANSQSRFAPAVMTPAYAAPEVLSGSGSFAMPPHSYDVYAAGLMYLELLCPSMNSQERFFNQPLLPFKVTYLVQRSCPSLYANIKDDLNLINSMVSTQARQRPVPKDTLQVPCMQPRAPIVNHVRVLSPPESAPVRSAPTASPGRVLSPPESAPVRIDVELRPIVPRVDLANEDPLFGQHVMDPNEVKEQQKQEGQQPAPENVDATRTYPVRTDLTLLPPWAVSKNGPFVQMQSYVSANAMKGWTWSFHTCEVRCNAQNIACLVHQKAGALYGSFSMDIPEKATQCYVYALATCTVPLSDSKKRPYEVRSYMKSFNIPSDFSK